MMAANLDSKATKWTGRAALVLAGWLACSGWYGTLTLHQKATKLAHVEAVEVPKLKSVAGCQAARADKASREAKASEAGDDVDLSKIPNCPSIKTVQNVGK